MKRWFVRLVGLVGLVASMVSVFAADMSGPVVASATYGWNNIYGLDFACTPYPIPGMWLSTVYKSDTAPNQHRYYYSDGNFDKGGSKTLPNIINENGYARIVFVLVQPSSIWHEEYPAGMPDNHALLAFDQYDYLYSTHQPSYYALPEGTDWAVFKVQYYGGTNGRRVYWVTLLDWYAPDQANYHLPACGSTFNLDYYGENYGQY